MRYQVFPAFWEKDFWLGNSLDLSPDDKQTKSVKISQIVILGKFSIGNARIIFK